MIDGGGHVVYIGHPMGIYSVIAQCTSGTFDLSAAVKAHKARQEALPLLDRFDEQMASGKEDEAYRLGRELVKGVLRDDVRSMLVIASTIASPESKARKKDLALALDAANRAVELTRGNDPGALSTLGRAHFESGEVNQAIEHLKKAVSLAEGGQKEAIRKELENCLRAKLPGSSIPTAKIARLLSALDNGLRQDWGTSSKVDLASGGKESIMKRKPSLRARSDRTRIQALLSRLDGS